jgi:hypothetical protein
MKCARCGKEAMMTVMSRFNTDVLCMPCEEKERKHPDYQYAHDQELAAVKNGDYNFPGVGWPGENNRVRR